MFEKLIPIAAKYEDIEFRLSLPETAADPSVYTALIKEYHNLTPLVEAYRLYRGLEDTRAEALELASMGFVPAGAYRNREYAQAGVSVRGSIPLAMEDILYDPQTSGGLLFAIPAAEAEACLTQLKQAIPNAAIIGYVTEKEDSYIILE